MKPSKNGTMTFNYDGQEAVIFYRKPSMSALGQMLEEFQGAESDDAAGMIFLERVCERFMISWNVEDDEGNSIPLTFEHMMNMPSDYVLEVIKKWAEVAAGAPLPLDMNSTDLLNSSWASRSFPRPSSLVS